jgi:hypothetical protein
MNAAGYSLTVKQHIPEWVGAVSYLRGRDSSLKSSAIVVF